MHDTCQLACWPPRETAALVHTVHSQSGVDRTKVRGTENNRRGKKWNCTNREPLTWLMLLFKWQLTLYWRWRQLLKDALLSNNVPCMLPRVKQRKCDEQNGEGHILNGMDAFIHKGAPNAKFCHYSASHSWGKLGFCQLSCGIALPIYRIYRKMDMQHCSRPTGRCEMLQI